MSTKITQYCLALSSGAASGGCPPNLGNGGSWICRNSKFFGGGMGVSRLRNKSVGTPCTVYFLWTHTWSSLQKKDWKSSLQKDRNSRKGDTATDGAHDSHDQENVILGTRKSVQFTERPSSVLYNQYLTLLRKCICQLQIVYGYWKLCPQTLTGLCPWIPLGTRPSNPPVPTLPPWLHHWLCHAATSPVYSLNEQHVKCSSNFVVNIDNGQ